MAEPVRFVKDGYSLLLEQDDAVRRADGTPSLARDVPEGEIGSVTSVGTCKREKGLSVRVIYVLHDVIRTESGSIVDEAGCVRLGSGSFVRLPAGAQVQEVTE